MCLKAYCEIETEKRVRLSARLIQAATGRLIWSEEYERAVRDLHALYGSVAAAIAAAVEVNLDDEDTRRVSLRRAVDPDAHQADPSKAAFTGISEPANRCRRPSRSSRPRSPSTKLRARLRRAGRLL